MLSIRKEEIAQASEVLGRAFFDDPIWKGFVPDDERRKQFLPPMFDFILRCGHVYGGIWKTSDLIEGVALWFPGKTANLTFLRILFAGLLGRVLKLMSLYKQEMKDMQANMGVLDKDRKRLMRRQNYLYLMAIGVDPDHQREGHGGMLLKRLFDESCERSVPIYLETETEENVRIYGHYGFETIGERDFAHKGFHIWQMVRPADSPRTS